MVKARPLPIAILITVGFIACWTEAQPTANRPEVRDYALKVSFFPEESRMVGIATIVFRSSPIPITELAFYVHGELTVEAVESNGVVLPIQQRKAYSYEDYSLIVTRVVVDLTNQPPLEELTVRYGGYFHPSKARSPSDYMRIEPEGVYLRAWAYSPWFPIFHREGEGVPKASFSRVLLETPKDFVSVFTGEKLHESVEGNRRISEWRSAEIPLFDAQCTVHRFSVLRDGNFFVYARPDQRSREMASEIAAFAAKLRTLLQTHYRKEAHGGQVHLVEMPPYGDISSGNVVGLASARWHEFADEESAKRTLAHEFVHPFVGFDMAQESSLQAMVIEGFPSYFHLPILAEIEGEAYYERILDEAEKLYIQRRRTGMDRRGRTLPPERTLAELNAEDIGRYKDRFVLNDRVLLFFDFLRRGLGRERFLDFSHELLNQPQLNLETLRKTILDFGFASAEDLRVWLETTEFTERFFREKPKSSGG